MRRWTIALVLAAFGLAGCGGGETEQPDQRMIDLGNQTDVPMNQGAGPPPCPFNTQQVRDFTSQPMSQEDDSCMWRGKDGVGSVTITTSSALAGDTTFSSKRQMAADRQLRVSELGVGEKSYLAVGELEAEAVVINGKGSYTLTLSSLQGADYGKILRDMTAALPS